MYQRGATGPLARFAAKWYTSHRPAATKSLLEAGIGRVAKKFGEEAVEAVIAAAEKDGEELMARIVATEARAKQGPWIHAEEPVFDWGTIEEGTEIRHTFLLTNRGTELVTIDKARTNCGCGAFDFSREIPPGGEGHLTIVIPGNKVVAGKLRASITLRTNARGDDVLVATGRVSARVAEGR